MSTSADPVDTVGWGLWSVLVCKLHRSYLQSGEHSQCGEEQRRDANRVDNNCRLNKTRRMVAVGQKLTNSANHANDTQDDGKDPTRGSVEAMTGADNECGDQGWYVDDDFHN